MVVTLVVLASLAGGPLALAQDASDEPLMGQVATHLVRRGETLSSIGARYGIDSRTLASENGMSVAGILEVGRALRIDNRHVVPAGDGASTLVINIPQRMLFYRDGAVTGLPVAVGRPGWETPRG